MASTALSLTLKSVFPWFSWRIRLQAQNLVHISALSSAPSFCPICLNWTANFNKTCLKLQKWRILTSKQRLWRPLTFFVLSCPCNYFHSQVILDATGSGCMYGPNQITRPAIRHNSHCLERATYSSFYLKRGYLAFFASVAFFCASVIRLPSEHSVLSSSCHVSWGDACICFLN